MMKGYLHVLVTRGIMWTIKIWLSMAYIDVYHPIVNNLF